MATVDYFRYDNISWVSTTNNSGWFHEYHIEGHNQGEWDSEENFL